MFKELVFLNVLAFGNERCDHAFVKNLFEIDVVEPGVFLEFLDAGLFAAEAVGGVVDQQLRDECNALLGEPVREGEGEVEYLLEKPFAVGVVERRHAHRHFVGDAAHGPHVDLLAMALAEDDLRCELLRGAHLVGVALVVHVELAEPEVSDLDVARGVEHDVFGLEVALNDAVLVQVVEDHDDLGHLELGPELIEFLVDLDVLKEFPA